MRPFALPSSLRPSLLSLLASVALTSLACSGADENPGGDGDGDGGGIGASAGDGDGDAGTTGGASTGGALVATGGSTAGSGGTGPGTGAAPGSGGTDGTGGGLVDIGPSHIVVVAHQDDDLLFINPELKRAIDRGDALTTVYVTSGNAGMDMTYVLEREAGIKSAYAFMADATNSWTCGMGSYAGKSVNECTLNGEKDVMLVFFRLVDGWSDGSDPNSLMNLWRGTISSSAAVDGSGLSFTRGELVSALADVLGQRGATHVHTTDFSFRNRSNDHSDHENAALFTVAASGAYSGAHQLSSYITYGTTDMAENLSPADSQLVGDTFGFYASCDSELPGCVGGPACDQSTCSTSSSLYISWYSRLYSFSRRTPPFSGTLSSSSGCVTASGAQATIASCTGATTWSWGTDYTLQTPDGMCLTAPALGTSSDLTLSACNGSNHQRWFVMDNGQVNLAAYPEAGDIGGFALAQCLDAGWGAGSNATVDDCTGEGAQIWTL